MNGLDMIVVAVILLSALFGFTRGLVKEALSIAAWIGAGLAAAYGFAYVIPARLLPKGPVTAFIAVGVLFLVTLVVLSFVASMLSSRVRQSTLSTLDRTLGLVFGLLRGALLVCLGYIALDWAMPTGGERPTWIEEARTRYLLESGADRLRALVPRTYRDKAANAINDSKLTAEQIKEATGAIRALSNPKAPPATQGRGSGSSYSPDDRHELNRLMQQRQDER
jgi:membrane protein required for colicin V production